MVVKTYSEGYIYMIENNFDSKIYIGCTVFPIEKRFAQHKNSANKKFPTCLFHLFMKEHGVENFFISCLHTELKTLNSMKLDWRWVVRMTNFLIFQIY